MTVQELIELLETVTSDAEVRRAHQPSWPLAFHFRGMADPTDAGTRATKRTRPTRWWSGSWRAATPTTRRTRRATCGTSRGWRDRERSPRIVAYLRVSTQGRPTTATAWTRRRPRAAPTRVTSAQISSE
jgi:hypothetical protein